MKHDISSIVVTGLSVFTAAGNGLEPLRELLRSGGDAFTALPDDVLKADGYVWGKNNVFKASDFMPPMKARKMDRCSQFAVSAAGLALKDAGIDLKEVAPERVGVVLGSGFCGISSSAEFLTGYFTSGAEGLLPMIFPNTVPNAPASNASIELGIKGPNATTIQRFCSAESALLLACRFIEEGRADIVLTGGTDELNPLLIKGFKAMGVISPTSNPFGEGCGILVLESAEHAARRSALVRARLESVSTIGMLAAGCEEEGLDLLLGDSADDTLLSFSGFASDLPYLAQRLPGSMKLDIGRKIGRSLAMGGTALAYLLDSLQPGQTGLHIAASPQGPFFAIRCIGGPSV